MTDTQKQDTLFPAEILEAAAACYAECEQMDSYGIVETIAKFLMARDERAAKIADAHSLDFEKQAERQSDGEMHDSLLRVADGCELVATAIRSNTNKGE